MEDTSSSIDKIDPKSINSLIRKSAGLNKILKQAEFKEIKEKLTNLDNKFDEIESRMADPLSNN
tara:strand:- start:1504 stop:1695 length:192 start_codon:yes stop_codon:yes gene_type:complete